MSLQSCLPADLQGPSTTITRIAAGLSGAGVYRVDAGGQAFVLKLAGDAEPIAAWRTRLHIQQLAATAGVAPHVIHADEAQRAVLSAFIVDRSFRALWADPRTREAALVQLGRTLRRVHDLPLPPEAVAKDERELLAAAWAALAGFAMPDFVGNAVQRMLTESPPPRERAPVLSHNDVNPSNLALDGEGLVLIDWDNAGPNDPLYDLAAISVFLRMDDDTCLRLIAAHDDAPVAVMPARFAYSRRMVAVLCGATFLHLARLAGHPGAAGGETLEATPGLHEVYQRMRAGLDIASGEGKWGFGMAMIKASTAL